MRVSVARAAGTGRASLARTSLCFAIALMEAYNGHPLACTAGLGRCAHCPQMVDIYFLNLFLDVVAQSSSGMLVESFLEDEELARTARAAVFRWISCARRCQLPGSLRTAEGVNMMC